MIGVWLLQVAFDGIGSMPMARIENYRQVKQEAVDFEMKRRNARKNLDHAIIASPQGQEMQDSGTDSSGQLCMLPVHRRLLSMCCLSVRKTVHEKMHVLMQGSVELLKG